MANKKVIITKEGLAKLQDELDHLILVERKEVSQAIKEAREQGDLSENAEYDAARERQAELENRILELEEMIKNAEVIKKVRCKDTIGVGCTVVLYDKEFKEELQYEIVGATEADPFNGKISNESPVGQGLIGLKKGESVDIEVPNGKVSYEVRDIK